MDAPIRVTYDLENASIIGASFSEPIWIGIKVKGTIVATDPEAGQIASVQIGYETDTPTPYANKPHGLTGIDCPPMPPTLAPPIDAFDADDWLSPDLGQVCTADGSTTQALVRARHMGICHINSVSTRYETVTARKQFIPRIEAQTIDDLVIGELREGVV